MMDGKITKYAAAVGYAQSEYSATIQAHNDFKTFSASYHHRVSPLLEVRPLSLLSPLFYSMFISCSLLQAAGKASFDPKATSGGVALEIAAKYLLDKDTFVKVSISPLHLVLQ